MPALDNMAEIKILHPDPFKHADDATSLSSTVDNNSVSSEEDDSFHEGSSITGYSSPKVIHQPFGHTDLKDDLANNQKLLAIAKVSDHKWNSPSPFTKFRWQYLLAYIGIMLADGLLGIEKDEKYFKELVTVYVFYSYKSFYNHSGTHLYVLYEGYSFLVASLYSLGFFSGALSSPFTGAFIDKFGRKKAAMLYCILEIAINYMEQYPIPAGLVFSRIIGGITTNLHNSCFEAWLATEHRKRGFSEDKLEIILRDSGVCSNSAAILSGFLAHALASAFGPVGPFQARSSLPSSHSLYLSHRCGARIMEIPGKPCCHSVNTLVRHIQ